MNCIKESPINILIQPTDNCNLACLYCYKGEKANNIMNENLLLRVLDESIKYNSRRNNSTLFIWHGGEPSMMSPHFYSKAFSFTEELKSEQKITHTIQTNGYNLSQKLIDLLAQYKVSISVSLDGPKNYHDTIRFTRNGKGSFDKILKNIERAKEIGLEIGILMSITNDNLQYIEEMFNYCRENGFSFGINPITADLFSRHEELEVTSTKYLEACIKVFDLWFRQKNNIIRANPGFGITQLVLSQNRITDCFLSENCQMTFISVDPLGNIYPCNRFDNNEIYKFGNINDCELEIIMKSPVRQKLLSRNRNAIPKCKDCEIKKYCNGGCMHHAISHFNNVYSPDHLCEVYIGLIKHALHNINQSLNLN
jgi:uncharacterized protein